MHASQHSQVQIVAAMLALAFVHPLFGQSASPLQQVFAAERSFARAMTSRDLTAFADHVSEEAIFFTGPAPFRGRQQVVDGWPSSFSGTNAPFSWESDQDEVLDSGTLALSTGLVRGANGKVIGRFNSTWRLERPGTWRVVFDKGSPPESGDSQ